MATWTSLTSCLLRVPSTAFGVWMHSQNCEGVLTLLLLSAHGGYFHQGTKFVFFFTSCIQERMSRKSSMQNISEYKT